MTYITSLPWVGTCQPWRLAQAAPQWYDSIVNYAQRPVTKAMAVIRRPRDGALLVSEDANPAGARFHRPLGGHVEFGEYAEHAVRREFLEEIDQSLTGVRLLGILENIFEWNGAQAHEVVFLFAAAFRDTSAYEIAEQSIADDPGERVRVIWRDPAAVDPPLYPDGVADLLARDLRVRAPD